MAKKPPGGHPKLSSTDFGTQKVFFVESKIQTSKKDVHDWELIVISCKIVARLIMHEFFVISNPVLDRLLSPFKTVFFHS